jgi:hypothetical protein
MGRLSSAYFFGGADNQQEIGRPPEQRFNGKGIPYKCRIFLSPTAMFIFGIRADFVTVGWTETPN